MKFLLVVGLAASLTACATAPLTPMQLHLNKYVGTKLAADHCPAQAGGYGDIKQMHDDGVAELEKARALGATDKDVAEAESRMGPAFVTMAALIGQREACGTLISKLAT